MKVVVEILTGALFYVQLNNDATFADLKRDIAAQQNLPHDRLILCLENSQNNHLIIRHEEEASLIDFGIRDGSHIYLFFSPLDDGSVNDVVFANPEHDLFFM
ncbi:hypothetical protein K2173_018892 [Erythroxylum novogranatense]|uniref:Ubiquitin-like domain-containing protein n=1 Tax=Erythroxylum novogranatense TaxID=1862640 RepID=A0AAV8SBP6_9ROSI|nr:hypothetical protein K2173_018892 [Erythroxylum novogranatense]